MQAINIRITRADNGYLVVTETDEPSTSVLIAASSSDVKKYVSAGVNAFLKESLAKNDGDAPEAQGV